MKKTYLVVLVLVVFLIGLVYWFGFRHNVPPKEVGRFSLIDGAYTISGKKVVLVNGVSEESAAPGSASKIVTRYFGNEVKHDFDGDGREDTAFLLTQQTGGSGTFYYLVFALNKETGVVGSDGFYLGDRIAPQTTEMGKGNVVIVNYADRNKGESFAVQPSLGKSIWALLDTKTMQIGEVAQNFEGEADPSRMSLGMKVWVWVKTVNKNNTEVMPKIADKFKLSLKDGKFSATTDCNSVGGEYSVKSKDIIFSGFVSTLMYCDGSQEGDFVKMLEQVKNYSFTSKGELIFGLGSGGDQMIFK